MRVPSGSHRLGKLISGTIPGILFALTLAVRLPAASRAGSDYLINGWRSEDGLPQNSVNCLAQTPDGYLWIGTRSGGLARFDGNRFVTFNPQSTPELRDVEFESLSVDATGSLWITAGNESIACLTAGKFRLVREPNAAPRWHPLQIPIVTEDNEAVYMAAYGSAVFRLPRHGAINQAERLGLTPPPPDPPPGRFSRAQDGALWYLSEANQVVRMQCSTPSNVQSRVFDLGAPAEALTRNQAGEIWVATDKKIGVMTTAGFEDRTPKGDFPLTKVRQMVPARDGALWIWAEDEVRKLDHGKWALTVRDFRPPPNREPLRLFSDAEGGLWAIEYGAGLWHVSPDGTAVLLRREDGLPSRFITCWLEDKEGNIWVGTKEAGLARIRHRQFKEYTTADGVPDEVTQSVCEDAQGVIWVGTATGGLARKTGDRFVPVPLTTHPDPLVESVTVCPDATNGIWIGTLQGSVFRSINDEVRCVNSEDSWTFPLDRLRDHVANAMMQDSSGRVWFGNGSGASYYQGDKLTAFGGERGFVDGIGVRALAEGPNGTLWLGTEPGDLWRITNDVPTRFHPPEAWPHARVSALLPDSEGGVWIGTLGGGLMRFADGAFTRVTKEQGLPDNSITQLLDDGHGNLWAGTYAGLFHAAKRDLRRLAAGEASEIALSVHGRFDGLPAQAYSGWFQPSCWRSRDGRLWFTTVKGLVAVNPRDVMVDHRPPPVIIEEMHVDGETRDLNTGSSTAVRIGPGRHYVEFRFTGINFSAPDAVRFRWRLEGVEKTWRESVSQRLAGYGPLLPGNYRFSVRAANSDGFWNETGDSIAFVVLPFFWETWWFKTLLAAIGCVALALAVAFKLRRRHRLELETLARSHEMERERTRIAQDMHDEIGSKLARISFLSEIARNDARDAGSPGNPVEALSKTARELLLSLERMVWAVNPRNDSLEELTSYLNRYASEYFQSTPIRCRLAFPKNLPAVQLSADTRHNLFHAFGEALANTLKHSRATQVSAELTYSRGLLEICITDNGCGFDPQVQARQRSGAEHLGLSGMAQRLRSIGGECRISSSPNQGTCVKFVLPLRKPNER